MTSYGTPADKVSAYTFQAQTLCPTCVIDVMLAMRPRMVSPAASCMPTEDALDQVAESMCIDRMDEHTFDSDEFPKVVFSCQIESDEHCDGCGEELV